MTSSLFTATVEFRRPGAQQWEIIAQATDTLAGLVEWAAPAIGGGGARVHQCRVWSCWSPSAGAG